MVVTEIDQEVKGSGLNREPGLLKACGQALPPLPGRDRRERAKAPN